MTYLPKQMKSTREKERDQGERETIYTLSERLLRISGMSCCNLETRSVIWSSVIFLETPDCCPELDLLVDIVRVGVSEID